VTAAGPAVVPSVDIHRARVLVASGAWVLDVREDDEWEAGHAESAVHVPLGRLAEALASFPATTTVVVVCRSGRRSTYAVAALRSAGIDALNLDGGMRAWSEAGAPLVSRHGHPTII